MTSFHLQESYGKPVPPIPLDGEENQGLERSSNLSETESFDGIQSKRMFSAYSYMVS